MTTGRTGVAETNDVEARAAEARRALIARSAPNAVPLNIINSFLLAAFLVGSTPLPWLGAWLAAMAAVSSLRLGVLWRARRAGRAPSERELNLYTAASAVVGGLWGATPFLLTPESSDVAFGAVALMIAGMSAGGALTSAAVLRVVVAYSAPPLALFAVWYGLQGGLLHFLMAGLLILFFFIMLRLARTYHATLTDAVKANAHLEESRAETEAQSLALSRLADRHEAAARAAEEQARAHAAMLANMRHELRTPLNGILGLSEILKESGLEPEQARMAARIQESGQSLSTLIQDIIDVSRIEADRFELHLADTTARRLAQRAEAFAAPLARKKGLAFEVQLAGEADLDLRADEDRLMRLLEIYLGNAVRFTDQGGVTLTLSVSVDESRAARLRAEVRDTGMGVPESARAKLFDAFADQRMDPAIREAGTGLGLLLVKRFALRMGGDAGYRPADTGRGSVFWFEAGARASAKADRYHDNETLDLSHRRLRLLVGEGEAARRSVLLGYLKSFNCSVACASSSSEVMDALAAQAYDAVVIGLSLDDADPADAAADIRSLPSTASLTPVVRLAEGLDASVGRSGGEILARAPVTPESLIDALSAALGHDPAAAASLRKLAS